MTDSQIGPHEAIIAALEKGDNITAAIDRNTEAIHRLADVTLIASPWRKNGMDIVIANAATRVKAHEHSEGE